MTMVELASRTTGHMTMAAFLGLQDYISWAVYVNWYFSVALGVPHYWRSFQSYGTLKRSCAYPQRNKGRISVLDNRYTFVFMYACAYVQYDFLLNYEQ